MSRSTIVPLTVDGATIRSLDEADLPATLAWRNHHESRRWFLTTDVIEPRAHEEWYARYLDRDDDHVFIVEVDATPRAQVAISDVRDGRGEFGRMLVDPQARGQGIARRATELCLRVAREQWGLRELELEVRHDNVAAIRTYERAGFVRDGETRDGIVHMSIRLASPSE